MSEPEQTDEATPGKAGTPVSAGSAAGHTGAQQGSKHDPGHDLGLVLVGGFLAIVGGVGAQYFHAQYQREQAAIELRIQELRDARGALQEISDRLDEPIARGLLLQQAIRSEAPDSTIRARDAAYRAAMDEWHVGYSRTRVLANVYFGSEIAADIEDFHLRLAHLEESLAESVERIGERERFQRVLHDRPSADLAAKVTAALESLAELDRAIESMVTSLRETAYSRQRLWAALVQGRRVGSFDPLASFMLTPSQERELNEDYQEDAAKADSASNGSHRTTADSTNEPLNGD